MRLGDLFRAPDRASGRDPDVRFSLANERTFLAWIRTSLALVGGGLAIHALLPAEGTATLRDVAALVLVGLGALLGASSFVRWARNETAMRHDHPIPASVLPALLSLGVLVVAVLVAGLLVATGGAPVR